MDSVPTTDPLIAASNELAALRDKPAATPQPVPAESDLHPKLVELLAGGALALKLQGVDLNKVDEFTKDARSRGLRRRALVFGRHPKGHTWFATPENHGEEVEILVINRLDRLSTTEMGLDGFVDLCVKGVQASIDAAKERVAEEARVQAAKEHAKRLRAADKPALSPMGEPLRKGRGPVKVRLPETNGALVTADGKAAEFTPDEWSYILWSMEGLQMLTPGDAPDLSRWESRCLRQCGLDEVPATDSPERAAYDENWLRLTRRDRAAPGPISHQISAHKIASAGTWVLSPNEFAVLRRNEKATAPRHRPTKEQREIWKRWMNQVKGKEVAIVVR